MLHKPKYLPIILSLLCIELYAQSNKVPIPTLEGDWWSISGNPELGKYNSDKQQPVDFGIWKAEDGTWQLWSCIRGSNFPGSVSTTRFLYGWEGKSLTSTNWEPSGIKWVAKASLGETPGGVQAPYVIKEDNWYYLFYGDWQRICLAKSLDGKNFERVLGGNGEPDLFSGFSYGGDFFYSRARDPMVIKRGNTYFCYYTNHIADPINNGAAFVRVSLNMTDWSESVMISRTAAHAKSRPRYSDECPYVVYLSEYDLYYLFVTQKYGKEQQTTVYASPNPMYFGIDDDSRRVCTLPIAAPEIIYDNGEYYLAALNPGLDGIRMIKLSWK